MIRKLFKAHPIKLVLWVVLINIAKSFLLVVFGLYKDLFDIEFSLYVIGLGDVLKIIGQFVVFTPLLETFLFQYLIISGVTRWAPGNWKSALLLSSFVFALFHTHYDGNWYFLFLFDKWIGGFSLALLYLVLKRRKKRAFLYTALSHAAINGIIALYILARIING